MKSKNCEYYCFQRKVKRFLAQELGKSDNWKLHQTKLLQKHRQEPHIDFGHKSYIFRLVQFTLFLAASNSTSWRHFKNETLGLGSVNCSWMSIGIVFFGNGRCLHDVGHWKKHMIHDISWITMEIENIDFQLDKALESD